MSERAIDQVRAITRETTRRKAVWQEMQVAAREAVKAVTAEARRRQVRGQNWLGGEREAESLTVRFPTYLARSLRIAGASAAGHAREELVHQFELHGSGSLERPQRATPYAGYPNVERVDVPVFKKAAVNALMSALNAHVNKSARARRKRNRG